jgi:hypothetical protein
MSIKITYSYKIEWIRGQWVVFECSDYLEEEIFASELRSEAEAFLHDLQS